MLEASDILIGHLADTHLAECKEDGKALEDSWEGMRARKVDLVIHAGDVFESSSNVEQRNLFKDFVDGHARNGTPVVVIQGNHEETEDILVYHNPPMVYVHTYGVGKIYFSANTRRLSIEPGDYSDLQIIMIPHFNTAAIAAVSGSISEMNSTGTNLFDDILDSVYQMVASYPGRSIVVTHAVIDGAALDSGRIPKLNGIHLSLSRLEALGCPVMAGHYHSFQALGARGLIAYSGDTYRKNYGEKGDKGFCLWQIGPRKGDYSTPEFVSLNPRDLILLEYVWDTDTASLVASPTSDSVPDDLQGAMVRIRVNLTEEQKESEQVASAIESFRSTLVISGAAEKDVKVERIIERKSAVRNSEIRHTAGVKSKLRVWYSSKGITPEKAASLDTLYDDIIEGAKA